LGLTQRPLGLIGGGTGLCRLARQPHTRGVTGADGDAALNVSVAGATKTQSMTLLMIVRRSSVSSSGQRAQLGERWEPVRIDAGVRGGLVELARPASGPPTNTSYSWPESTTAASQTCTAT
jgi:hypothetical protein